MAIICKELGDKRKLKLGVNASATTEWAIDGTDSEVLALEALYPQAPNPLTWVITGWTTWTGAIIDIGVEQVSDQKWIGKVVYGDPSSNVKAIRVGASQFDFEIGGGTQKIFAAYTEQIYNATGQSHTSFNKTIGDRGPDGVDGCDIVVPDARFSVTWMFNPSTVNAAYRRDVMSVAKKPVNNASFYGYAAGEVLFLGAAGRRRSQEKWELTFRFAYSPNLTGLNLGNGITGVSKLGHQYLWYRYQTVPGNINTPECVVVNDVYDFSDFSILGIGTTDTSY